MNKQHLKFEEKKKSISLFPPSLSRINRCIEIEKSSDYFKAVFIITAHFKKSILNNG